MLTLTEWSIIAYDPVFRFHSLVVFHALTPLLNVEGRVWRNRVQALLVARTSLSRDR